MKLLASVVARLLSAVLQLVSLALVVYETLLYYRRQRMEGKEKKDW